MSAQSPRAQGTDFWVAYPEQSDKASAQMVLYLTAETAGSATITVGNTTLPVETLTPNGTTVVPIDRNIAYVESSEQTGDRKGIHVTATQPVTVQAQIYLAGRRRTANTLVLPTSALGQEYLTFSYRLPTVTTTEKIFSSFTVVAAENNTTVQITPAKTTLGGKNAGIPYLVTLQAGEVYQVKSALDLTGSRVSTLLPQNGDCKKVAVFSGSSYVQVGCPTALTTENLYQQMLPLGTWGKQYATVGFLNRPADEIKVLVNENNTSIRVNGGAPVVKNRGEVHEFTGTGPIVVTADKPVAVAQFAVAQNCDTRNSGSTPAFPGDGEMLILQPLEQMAGNTLFYRPVKNNGKTQATYIDSHYLTVILKTSEKESFKINGVKPTAAFADFVTLPGYSYLQENLSAAADAYPVLQLTADGNFSAYAFGYGNQDSYALSTGGSYADLTKYLEAYRPVALTPGSCPGEAVSFKAFFPNHPPARLDWDFGDNTGLVNQADLTARISPEHTYTQAGNYTVRLIITNASATGLCAQEEMKLPFTIREKPAAAFDFSKTCSQTATEFQDASVVAAGLSLTGWQWDFGDPASGSSNTAGTRQATHQFSGPGKYQVRLTVTASNGCANFITKEVVISPVPQVAFTAEGVCQTNPTVFRNQTMLTGGSIKSWNWDFGDGKASTEQHPSHTYAAAGTFRVTLKVITDNNCETSLTQEVVVATKPKAAFEASDACLGNAQTFADKSSGNPVKWFWDFGDGNTAQIQSPVYTFTRAGIYTVRLTVTSSQGCEDFLSKTIAVGAAPVAQAGPDQLNLCGVTSTRLDANLPATGPGTWSVVSGNGTGTTFGNAGEAKTTFTGKAGETYTLRWSVKNAPCPEATDEVLVQFNAQPAVSAGPDRELIRRQSITLAGSGGGGYRWFPAEGLSDATLPNPVASPDKTTTYELTVTSAAGCTATDRVTITVLDKLRIPNAFSPNGDGTNDSWVIEGLAAYRRATVEVFDRWGSRVFSGGSDGVWDGNLGGKSLPMGTYYYIIRQNNGEKPLTGTISIVK